MLCRPVLLLLWGVVPGWWPPTAGGTILQTATVPSQQPTLQQHRQGMSTAQMTWRTHSGLHERLVHTSQAACLLQLTTSKSYGSRGSQLMQQGRLSSKTSLPTLATGCRTACRAPPGLLPAPGSCTQHWSNTQRTIQLDRGLQSQLHLPALGTESSLAGQPGLLDGAQQALQPPHCPALGPADPACTVTKAPGPSNRQMIPKEHQAKGPTEPSNQLPYGLEADVK